MCVINISNFDCNFRCGALSFSLSGIILIINFVPPAGVEIDESTWPLL